MLKIQKHHTETSDPEVPLPLTRAEVTPSLACSLLCWEIYQAPERCPNNTTEEGEERAFSCF